MGTVYRTDCGYVASKPEPLACEYQDQEEFIRQWHAWDSEWWGESESHTLTCPLSAYRVRVPGEVDYNLGEAGE